MRKPKLVTYGHGGTIHGTNYVDVETDEDGKVVAVWFRCCLVPFKQSIVGADRANEMRYANEQAPKIHAIVVEDRE